MSRSKIKVVGWGGGGDGTLCGEFTSLLGNRKKNNKENTVKQCRSEKRKR